VYIGGMFHWICPECGREIAPQERECPACDARPSTVEPVSAQVAEQPAQTSSVSTLGRTIKKEVRVRTLGNAPVRAPRAGSGRVASLPTQLAPSESPESIPWPDTGDLPLPGWSAPAISGNGLEDAISAMGMAEERPDPPVSGKLAMCLKGPETSGIPGRGIWTDLNLQPVPAKAHAPVVSDDFVKRGPATPQPKMQTAASVPWPRTKVKVKPRVSLSNAVVPAASAPSQPQSSKPAFAPGPAGLVVYSPLAGKPMQAVAPHQNALITDCLQRVTVPGPMLIKRLISFRDRELEPQFPEGQAFKKPLLPRWAWMALVGVTLLSAGFGSAISLLPRKFAPEKTTEIISRTAMRVSANPLSKAIEVTGFRILMNPASKSEIQYLVVNHSPNRFSGVTVFVTLRAANAQRGEPALCRFAFASPDLGPYEAREMSSEIEKLNRPVALPDWQDVRAELEIGE